MRSVPYRNMICAVALALFCIGFVSCEPDPNPVRTRQDLAVGSAVFKVELATTEDQRTMGLMHRTQLADNQGMLFVFDQDQHLDFWMKNTILPLSIAYISSKGEIKEILDMVPFSLQSVPSEYAVRSALEVNKGAFQRAGVKTGDMVVLPHF